MDPEEDVDPSNNVSWDPRSTQSVDRSSHTSLLPVIIRVSPAHDGEPFGYIYLTPGESDHQETVRPTSTVPAGRSPPCHAPTLRIFFLQTLSALATSPFYVTYLNISYAWDAGFSKTPPTPVMAALTFCGCPIHRLLLHHPYYLQTHLLCFSSSQCDDVSSSSTTISGACLTRS